MPSLRVFSLADSLQGILRAARHLSRDGGGVTPAAVGLLAVGEAVSLLDLDCSVLAELALPAPPLEPPVLGDFDYNGLTDVVLLTPEGYMGIALERRVGIEILLPLLAVALGVAVGAVLLQQLQVASAFAKPRRARRTLE